MLNTRSYSFARIILFLLIALAATTPAFSAAIDFEALATGSHPSVTTQNLQFVPLHTNDVLIRDNHTQALQPRWGDVIQISRPDGAIFDLASFDYRSQWPSVGGTAVITGFQAEGSQLTDSFTHDGNTVSATTKILNWTNLTLLEIDFQSTVQLDNIVLGEPSISTVIDFEAFNAGSYPAISSQGLLIEPVHTSDVLIRDNNTQALQPRWGDVLKISQADGAAFGLLSFDFRSQWPGVGGTAVITGYLADGSTLTDSFTHDGSSTATTMMLSWGGLTWVEIDFETTVQLDNLVIGSQPPPVTVINFEEFSAGSYPSISSYDILFAPGNRNDVLIRDTDTKALQPRWGDLLLISKTSGGAFDLASFDYRRQWSAASGTVRITGFKADGSLLEDTFAYDGNTLPTTKTLNWTALTRVEMQFQGTVQLDNFVIGSDLTSRSWNNPNSILAGNYPIILHDQSSGDAVTLWQSGNQIWSGRYHTDTSWEASELIAQGIDTLAYNTAFTSGIDPAGNITVAWKSSNQIWARRYSQGTGWHSAELIAQNTDSTAQFLFPETVVDSSSNITVLWPTHTEDSRSLWTSRYTAADGWSPQSEIMQLANQSAYEYPGNIVDYSLSPTSIDVDNTGKIMVIASSEIYQELSFFTDIIIYAVEFIPDTGWGIPQELDTHEEYTNRYGGTYLFQVEFNYNAAGNGILLTGIYSSDAYYADRYIYSKFYSIASGWSTSEIAASQQTLDISPVQPLWNSMAFDSEGNAILVYLPHSYDANTGSFPRSLKYTQYTPGIGWSPHETIIPESAQNYFFLESSQFGDILLAIGNEVRRYNSATGWSAPDVLAAIPPSVTEDNYRMAIDSTGRHAILVWSEGSIIHSTSWETNQDWSQPVSFPANLDRLESLDVDSQGNANLLWTYGDNIYASRYQ